MALRLPASIRRAALAAFQRETRRLHDLRYLFLEITRDCNLRCAHCGSDCRRESDGPQLEPPELLPVLRAIRDRFGSRRVFVAMTGGEPLCHPRVFELGSVVTSLGFPWGMVTNGFAWSPDTVARARAAGMQGVTISLDGTEAEHDWLRGVAGSYRRAMRTIRLLASEDWIATVDVVTCVHPRNLHRLEEIRASLRAHGVRSWRLFTISPMGRAIGRTELFLDAAGYQDLLRQILRWRREDGPSVRLSESGYLGPRFECRVRNGPYFCAAGIQIAGIHANGDIAACPNIDPGFVQGNIAHDDFLERWDRGYAPFRNRDWMRSRCGECAGCGEWSLCRGNSFHLWRADGTRPGICHLRDYELGAPGLG